MRRARAIEFLVGSGARHAAESYLTQARGATGCSDEKYLVASCERLHPARARDVFPTSFQLNVHQQGTLMQLRKHCTGGGRNRGLLPLAAAFGFQPPRSAEHHALCRRWIRPTSISSTATSPAGTATSRCSPTTSRCSSPTAALTISPWTRRRCTRFTSTTTAMRTRTSRSSSASPTRLRQQQPRHQAQHRRAAGGGAAQERRRRQRGRQLARSISARATS